MKCEDVVHAIPLYLYGEVSPAVEELVEEHTAGCAACARELEIQKALHAALDSRELTAPAGLLLECRGDLTRRIAREADPLSGRHRRLGDWFRDLLQRTGIPLRIPVSAMALIAIGYLAARLTGPAPLGTGFLGTTNASFGKRFFFRRPLY